MLHLSPRNRTPVRSSQKRHSVSIIEGELSKQLCSPFNKDRYLTSERKTPTRSPRTRPPPIPTGKKDSPYKSPISTPKKTSRFIVESTKLDAPDICDVVPNNIIALNEDNQLAVGLREDIFIRRNGDAEYFMQSASMIDALNWVDNRTLIMSTQGEVETWDVLAKKRTSKLQKHQGKVNCIEVCGRRVATAGMDKLVHITDLSTMKADTLEGHRADIIALAWSQDGVYLASCDTRGVLIVWGNKKRKKYHIDFSVSSVIWLTQTIIAIGGSDQDGSIQLLNIICPKEESKTIKTGSPISSISLCSKRGVLVAHRGEPFQWELYGRDLVLIDSFAGHENDIINIKSSSDGTCLVTISVDETIQWWSITDISKPLHHASSATVFTQLR